MCLVRRLFIVFIEGFRPFDSHILKLQMFLN